MLFNKLKRAILTVHYFSIVALMGCSATETPKPQKSNDTVTTARLAAPKVTAGGEEITFSALDSSAHLFEIDSASTRNVSVTTTSPARIVFSTTEAADGVPVPIFENADLTQLFTDYSKSLNDQARGKREVERLKDLFAHNAVAGKEVIQAESDLRTTEVALTGLKSRLLAAGLSPNELTRLPANTSLLIANVPEAEISNVQLGEDSQIEFDAYRGEIMHGKVIDIGKALDPSTRTFNVRINLSEKKYTLRPGMFAKASFGVDIARRFVVPAEAVISVQGKSYVFIKKTNGVFVRREVFLGSQTGNSFVVLSGLSQGEPVVTRGAILLKGLSFGS
ncbi:MAG: efflux RND transporter periplasmic adaptor subunit [Bacteroidota bacterium]|nr:efflux RND transporter periplasmic adaptor subunit [Bacteroidota bacterium]MDP4229017.1 efflux RND transporter periplasmic adaptor subunit [Bacteroidota bacterium]MDP4237305.1 efflux RND transporter periplasmic adaptor subunit [Bacteroidota bacterium]